MKNKLIYLFFFITAMIKPNSAFAHISDGNGFYAGLSHPVGGFDHLLAMLSIGILSVQIGGNYILKIPTAFVSSMLLGGLIGFSGINLSIYLIELSIILSVIFLGLVVASNAKISITLIYIFVLFFGMSHGYAHGVEIPIKAKPIFFALGFVISTIVIHMLGVFIGFAYTRKQQGVLLLQYTGVGITLVGFYLLIFQ